MIRTDRKPWRRQRILKRQHIPSQEWIYQTALRYTNLRERALFIVAYLTGGRISEIVRTRYLRKVTYQYTEMEDKHGNKVRKVLRNKHKSPIAETIEKNQINYPGILRMDVLIHEVRSDGKQILEIRMQNRKNKKVKVKSIPIPIHKEKRLVGLLFEYLDTLNPEIPLFPMSIRTAERIINKVDMNPHFLRNIRLTHLVNIYDFNAYQLTRFAGWTSASPAEAYVRLSQKDMIDKY